MKFPLRTIFCTLLLAGGNPCLAESVADTPHPSDYLLPRPAPQALEPLALPEWATSGKAESRQWIQTGVNWLTVLAWDEADRAFRLAERMERDAWATWGRGMARLDTMPFAAAFFQEASRLATLTGSDSEQAFFSAWHNFTTESRKGQGAEARRALFKQLRTLGNKPASERFVFVTEMLVRLEANDATVDEEQARHDAPKFQPIQSGWLAFHWWQRRLAGNVALPDVLAHAKAAATPAVWRWAGRESGAANQAWFDEAALRQRFHNLEGKPTDFLFAQIRLREEAQALLPRLGATATTELTQGLELLPRFSGAPPSDVPPSPPSHEKGLPAGAPDLASIGPLHWSLPPAATALLDRLPTLGKDNRWKLVNIYLDGNCPRCLGQLTALARLHDRFIKLRCDIVCIGADTEETVLQVKPTDPALTRFPFPLLADPKRLVSAALGCQDNFTQLPLHGTFLYDPSGHLRWWLTGELPFEDLPFLLTEIDRLHSK
jgi:peroxiredoxin